MECLERMKSYVAAAADTAGRKENGGQQKEK